MPSGNRRSLQAGVLGALSASAVALAGLPAAAAAGGPKVSVLVTGRAGIVAGPKIVQANAYSTVLGSPRKRCAVSVGTPLATLKAVGINYHLKDFASCSLKPSDSAGLFVDRIGTIPNTGISGWSFKVNNKAGTAGAADPAGPFGSGLIANGARVLWFWCVYDINYNCQRNLEIEAPATGAPGASVPVSVRAYDDSGNWIPAASVRVSGPLGSSATNAGGTARVRLPSRSGSFSITAIDGLRPAVQGGQRVPAFPQSIKVG